MWYIEYKTNSKAFPGMDDNGNDIWDDDDDYVITD